MTTTETKAPPRVVQVRVDDLLDSPTQPRRKYDQAKIEELAQRMRSLGFLGMLLGREVTDEDQARVVELVYGHRRKRAAKLAGIETVPVELRDLDDDQVLTIQLAENTGEPLTPLEEGDGLRALRDTGATVDELAASVGRPPAYVRQRIALAEAPRRVRAELDAGKIGVGHALLIAGLPEELQDDALSFALDGATLAGLRTWAEARSQDLARAPWDVTDASLHGGACKPTCDRRTGATADLFEGITGDRCLDGECWKVKLDDHQKTLAVPSDLQKALAARELELRPHGRPGAHPFDVVQAETGDMVIGTASADDVRSWLKGEKRGWAPLPPKRKQGKPLPAAEPEPEPDDARRETRPCPTCKRPLVVKGPFIPNHSRKDRGEQCSAYGGMWPGKAGKPAAAPTADDEAASTGFTPVRPAAELRDVALVRRQILIGVIEKLPLNPGDLLRRPELELVVEHVMRMSTTVERELAETAIGAAPGAVSDLCELSDRDLSRLLIAAALAPDASPTADEDGSMLLDLAQRLGVGVKEPKAAKGKKKAALHDCGWDGTLTPEQRARLDKPKAKKAPAKKKAKAKRPAAVRS